MSCRRAGTVHRSSRTRPTERREPRQRFLGRRRGIDEQLAGLRRSRIVQHPIGEGEVAMQERRRPAGFGAEIEDAREAAGQPVGLGFDPDAAHRRGRAGITGESQREPDVATRRNVEVALQRDDASGRAVPHPWLWMIGPGEQLVASHDAAGQLGLDDRRQGIVVGCVGNERDARSDGETGIDEQTPPSRPGSAAVESARRHRALPR